MSNPPTITTVYGGGCLQCTTYLVEAPAGLILIDPGSGIAEDKIAQALRARGHKLGDVDYALLTHCHADHTLGARRLHQWDVRLVASRRTAEILRSHPRQVWYEYPECVIPTEVYLIVEDGQVLDLCDSKIQCIATPGHTAGSMAYLVETDEGRTMFLGDLIDDRANPGWAGSDTFSEVDTLASIEKVLRLGPDKICWGHGVINEPPEVWLERALRKAQAGTWKLNRQQHPDVKLPNGFERGTENNS